MMCSSERLMEYFFLDTKHHKRLGSLPQIPCNVIFSLLLMWLQPLACPEFRSENFCHISHANCGPGMLELHFRLHALVNYMFTACFYVLKLSFCDFWDHCSVSAAVRCKLPALRICWTNLPSPPPNTTTSLPIITLFSSYNQVLEL